jgi:glyoxylase-like metal-dependent hydrolase (beta-lactamase superfamily II)
MQSLSGYRSLLAIAAIVTIGNAQAQQPVDWDSIELRVEHVAGSIYMLVGQGGNIGLSIGNDGVIMIDDQFAPLTDRIVATIGEVTDEEIRFLINTHVHGDHVGGNENLGNRGVMIFANDRVRMRMSMAENDSGDPTYAHVALPVVTFSDTATLHLNGEEVHAFSVPPAHTDGDSFIHFRGSDVMHLGDVFRTNNFPYMDLSNGGGLPGTLDALGIAIGMAGPDTAIIPGHGGVSSREDVIEFRDMILVVMERVSEKIDEGMSYAEVAAAGTTAEYEAKWGDPARFLTGLYQELGGEL